MQTLTLILFIRSQARSLYRPLRSRIVTNAFCQDSHEEIRLFCAMSLFNHSFFPNVIHPTDDNGEIFAVYFDHKKKNLFKISCSVRWLIYRKDNKY